MFEAKTYIDRRSRLKKQVESGLILFPGHDESSMNYTDNTYPFRQDSSFLYFFGLDYPALAAVIDIDEDREVIYGDDLTVDQIVWMGPQPSINEKSQRIGVKECAPLKELEKKLRDCLRQGRQIHFLPQDRPENLLKIERLLGIHPRLVNTHASLKLTMAVVEQRTIKSEEEIREIEIALDTTYEMHTLAMRMSKPGMYEREVVGAMEGFALSRGVRQAYPIIFSIHGETLHNHYHGNMMKEGDIIVNDSGAESPLHYASDLTSTIPVSGKFTEKQKEIYNIVLRAQREANKFIKPGVKFKDVHLLACRTLASGLKDLSLMKGDINEAVQQGAHALFFQCGLGHMMGLDVHDMENLGEQYVGYDEETTRSSQFGLCYLRLAKAVQPGFVLTVEPGIYMIPELIDQWKAEKKLAQFINYDAVEKYRDFGGIRVEDNIVVTKSGIRVLGRKMPKTVEEVEAVAGS